MGLSSESSGGSTGSPAINSSPTSLDNITNGSVDSYLPESKGTEATKKPSFLNSVLNTMTTPSAGMTPVGIPATGFDPSSQMQAGMSEGQAKSLQGGGGGLQMILKLLAGA
jgi:hypothetical protein